MPKEIFSNHIGSSSELTILGKIIPGYVPGRFPITYAARLRSHLRLLGALRRGGLEGRRAGIYSGPIDALRTLQFVRWTLIENDTKLLLTVNFDRPLEPYVRRIVDLAGPLLDTILCNCEGFLGRSSDQGFHKFMSFAMENQAPVELFAASNPDVTTDDANYFLQADKMIRDRESDSDSFNAEYELARLKLKKPWEQLEESASNKKTKYALLDQGLNILQALYENHHFYPKLDLNNEDSRDDLLYYRLAKGLVPGFWRRQLLVILNNIPPGDLPPLVRDADEYDLSDDQTRAINQIVKKTIAKLPEEKLKLAPYNLLLRFTEARDWFGNPPEPRAPTPPKIPSTDSVQIGLTESPPRADVGCMLLLRIDSMQGGRSFLSHMDTLLWPATEGDAHWNLSITHQGLKTLEIKEELRLCFPAAFREGMAQRAGLLGDIGVNNPREWVWPTSNWTSAAGVLSARTGNPVNPESIDIIVQVAMKAEKGAGFDKFDEAHPLFDVVSSLISDSKSSGVVLLAVEPLQRRRIEGMKHASGHLNWADGISQPKFNDKSEYAAFNPARSSDDPRTPEKEPMTQEEDRSLIGDLLIGHPAKTDVQFNKKPELRIQPRQFKPLENYEGSSLENGTFQVIRKLKIDTVSFEEKGTESEKAKMIGRNRDGTRLGNNPSDPQDFNYVNDENGERTPLQSHIRRANPREASTPRILRRGWSYGPFDTPDKTFSDADRGLFFIAYNANISEQFEVIQRWVSGGNSTGISSWHGDPLLAPVRPGGSRTFRYLSGESVESVKLQEKPPATLQWGIYAFTPSQKGLRSLSEGGTVGEKDQINFVASTVDRITTADTEAQRDEWKLVLEDVDDERREDREAIWREIRNEHGGVLRTNYGVLVGSADSVEQVLLNKSNAFSVRHYWNRMVKTIGASHVCLDEPPLDTLSTDPDEVTLNTEYLDKVKPGDYTKVRDIVNPFFTKPTEARLFKDAYDHALPYLKDIPIDNRYLPYVSTPLQDGRRISSERFIYDVVASLCLFWFGLPDQGITTGGQETDVPHCPHDLIRGSFHVFWPHPTDHVKQASLDRTKALADAVMTYIEGGGNAKKETLMRDLFDKLPRPSDRLIADAVCGACFAFAGPTSGSFRAVLYDWIDTGQLWRMQQRLREAGVFVSDEVDFDKAKPIMEQVILDSMALRAAPDLLYRTAVDKVNLGGEQIEPGDTIVFSLRSAAEDDPSRKRFFLFGGDYRNVHTSTQPQHTCAGQRMALCTIMGALAAIMSFKEIRPEGPLSVRVQ